MIQTTDSPLPMRATCRVRSRSTSARDLPGALALDLGVRQVPSAHPANRPAHEIRQRQARLGVPLGTLRLAGVDLHSDGASSAHYAPSPLGGSEGAQPPASPCRGPATRVAPMGMLA